MAVSREAALRRARSLLRPATRRRQGRVLLEGVRVVETALAAGVRLEAVFAAGGPHADAPADPRVAALAGALRARGVPVFSADERTLDELTTTETPPGAVAIAGRPAWSWDEAARRGRGRGLFAVADALQDPGNLGTLIRSADAAGAAAMVAGRGTVDPYNPKAVRASAGSVFHLPVLEARDAAEAITWFTDRGVRIVVADAAGERLHTEVDWTGPVAVVIGNEGAGVGPEWARAAAERVRIPLVGRAESLNAAVAGSVILFEAARQRAIMGPKAG